MSIHKIKVTLIRTIQKLHNGFQLKTNVAPHQCGCFIVTDEKRAYGCFVNKAEFQCAAKLMEVVTQF